jgi:hypothetical protein
MMAKLTKADLTAREEARRNVAWLRELAERAYEDLERRGALTIRRPDRPSRPDASSAREASREQARANTEWLRELAEKAKADLGKRGTLPPRGA